MQGNERDFLRLVRDAVFSNPFGSTRATLDRDALGLTGQMDEAEVLPRLIEKVGNTLNVVMAQRKSGSSKMSPEDESLVAFGHLFHTFHRFCERYDDHIKEQIKRGAECCRASFAGDILAVLAGHGFVEHECRRFLALFFQMRRAFFFIKAIAGKSESVTRLRHALWNNVFTGDIGLYNRYLWDRMEDFSTMILGETGTGKGMAAAAIGRSGFIPYNDKTDCFKESFVSAFVAINLSQFPEQLIESELFGHRKGAFTGAIDQHRGILSACSPCGAIFLDEIGDVAVPVQIKLLHVLQERTFAPVGSHQSEKFKGRVIAATNKNLRRLRETGEFRDDFYYRLCSDVIEVPPLRQRLAEHPDELGELVAVTIERIVGRRSMELEDKLLAYIKTQQPADYPWPGNIRELEQCARQFLLSTTYQWQEEAGAENPAERLMKEISAGNITANQLVERYCTLLHRRHGTYEAVARLTGLDRRTVKKNVVE